MKQTELYYRCEYCDALIKMSNPPIEKDYENGRIEIKDGTMLLSKAFIDSRRNGDKLKVYAISIDGMYCDVDCLVKRLRKERGLE